jgi:RNA polymerase sigma-70 factor (ECF subfamily)
LGRNSERIFDEYLAAAAVTADRETLARLISFWQPRGRHVGDAKGRRTPCGNRWKSCAVLSRLSDVVTFPA